MTLGKRVYAVVVTGKMSEDFDKCLAALSRGATLMFFAAISWVSSTWTSDGTTLLDMIYSFLPGMAILLLAVTNLIVGLLRILHLIFRSNLSRAKRYGLSFGAVTFLVFFIIGMTFATLLQIVPLRVLLLQGE